MNIKLPNGQIISEKDPNYEEYKKQPSSMNGGWQYVNEQGLTMAEANDSSNWNKGSYTGGSLMASPTPIQNNINSTGTAISNTESDTDNAIDYNAQIQDILDRAKNINDFTSSELADIESAGVAVGNQYQELINRAQREKNLGLSKYEIGAGRMGGFMNTQFVGNQVEGGKAGWYGQGGNLEAYKSAYDANISDLETQKSAAIEAAKQARKTYIRTGKSEALNAIQNALTAAQTIQNNILANQRAKQDMLIAASQEARTAKTYNVTDATSSIANMAQAGLDASQIPQDTKAKYEQLLGLTSGSFDKFYEDVKLAASFGKEGRYVDFTAKIAEVLAKIPADQSITINGKVYKGTKTDTTSNDLDTLLTPTEAAALGVQYGTTRAQAAAQGLTPKSTLTGQDKVNMEVKLAGNFEQYAKDSREAQRQIKIMETGYNQAVQSGFNGESNNAPSQAVLVTFQKMLDPTSVVRESEYARSGSGQSIMQRIQGTVDKLARGGAGVTQKELKTFYDLSQQLLKGYNEEQLNFAKRIQTQAGNYGLNIENILTPDVLAILGGSAGTGVSNTPTGSVDWNGL